MRKKIAESNARRQQALVLEEVKGSTTLVEGE